MHTQAEINKELGLRLQEAIKANEKAMKVLKRQVKKE